MPASKTFRNSPSAPGKELPDLPTGAAEDDVFLLSATVLEGDNTATLAWVDAADFENA